MPDLQSLEDRVLYSASPVPIELLAEAPDVDVDLDQMDQQLDFLSEAVEQLQYCLLYTSPSPRDQRGSRMPSSA